MVTSPLYSKFSFLQTIILIWIFGTVAEEMLMRGLVQGYLSSLQVYGMSIAGIRISLPVFIAAFYFGLMHVGILSMGASASFVTFIVLFTFFVGADCRVLSRKDWKPCSCAYCAFHGKRWWWSVGLHY